MKFLKSTWQYLTAAVLVLGLTQCQKSVEQDPQLMSFAKSENASMHMEKTFKADLHELNGSGVMGTATVMLSGDEITVHIEASGLEENMVHPQHIHGFTENNRNSTCPTMAADDNGDGLIQLGEGLPSYGGVLLPLTEFPTAPDGTIDYTETFSASELGVNPMTLQNRAIVLHGMTVNNEYVPTLPVACGQLRVSR